MQALCCHSSCKLLPLQHQCTAADLYRWLCCTVFALFVRPRYCLQLFSGYMLLLRTKWLCYALPAHELTCIAFICTQHGCSVQHKCNAPCRTFKALVSLWLQPTPQQCTSSSSMLPILPDVHTLCHSSSQCADSCLTRADQHLQEQYNPLLYMLP